MKWRKWNNILHRDIGYLCVGLTLVYVISGIAVNHMGDWNPSFSVETSHSTIRPVQSQSILLQPEEIRSILSQLGLPREYRNSFQPDPQTLRIFQSGNTITVNLKNGQVVQEKLKKRFLLYEFNVLHLNRIKSLWTIVADIYAVALGIVAITGLFVLRGKKGIKGRGAWLTGAGILIPLVFILVYL